MFPSSVPVISGVELDSMLSKDRTSSSPFSTGKLLLVDFFADWCSPCRVVAPKVQELAERYPAVRVVKVDVSAPQSSREALDIRGLPTFKIYKDGLRQFTYTGTNIDTVEQTLQKIGKMSD